MSLAGAFRSLVNLVYPPRCLLCKKPHIENGGYFCLGCEDSLGKDPHLSCPCCAATVGPHGLLNGTCPSCRAHPMAFDGVMRLGIYDDMLKWAVVQIKHSSQEGLAEVLGEMLGRNHWARLAQFRPDLIIPMPLHWRKRLRRGYNQSLALARGLGFILGISPNRTLLRRIRHTREQHLIPSMTGRRQNVQGAFVASPFVKGRRILLVDDVMTTGATAHEASRALKNRGATSVFVSIVARTRG